MQRVTRGSALVGKLYGTIVADAGSISSTELANKAVTATKVALANTKVLIGGTTGAMMDAGRAVGKILGGIKDLF